MKFNEIIKKENLNDNLDTLEKKINFNKSLFKKELETLGGSDFCFSVDVDEVIKIIRSTEEKKSILGFIKYKNKDYNLHFMKNSNQQGHRFDFYNKEETFKTARSVSSHVAGWIDQGGFTFSDEKFSYHTEDHWGVAVSEELKGSRFADILYNLKCQVDDQLEFEHVSGSNLQMLTFYIKKGYVPYSFVKLDPVHEEIIDKDKLKKVILEIKEAREGKNQSDDKDYALRLKLDPKEASIIYSNLINKNEK
jgi:hypothetical protein